MEGRTPTDGRSLHNGSEFLMKHVLPAIEDSNEIANFLIAELGLDRALETTMEEITRANEAREYYLLSVWRDVRSALRQKVEPVE